LKDITQADGEEWQRWLKTKEELSSSTLAKRTKFARQFFQYAVKKRWLLENPFQGLPITGSTNPDRQRFITREMIERVLAECPDAEWRLIIALSRYGGLRMPSEGLALTWDHIDWEHDRMTVPSPKTERTQASRTIPIFPELRPFLNAVWDEAEGEQRVYVLHKYRHLVKNMRTQLRRFITRAGLTPWPKLFHNLRASRETELAKDHPLHVACAWIGNSERIALRHYCQVTEEDFRSALQNPVQMASEGVGMGGNSSADKTPETPKSPVYSDDCCCLPPEIVEPKGPEHLGEMTEKSAVAAKCAADSGALFQLVRVWPQLTDPIRRQILQLAGVI
jgi:site-specific recombinase XerD